MVFAEHEMAVGMGICFSNITVKRLLVDYTKCRHIYSDYFIKNGMLMEIFAKIIVYSYM